MSVRPVTQNADGSIIAVCDETGHTGPLTTAAVGFVKRADGSMDPTLIALACPDGCGAVSTSPVAGGAAPAAVQELFVRTARRLGCPCGQMPAGRPMALVQGHVKLHSDRMDGPPRWSIVGTLT